MKKFLELILTAIGFFMAVGLFMALAILAIVHVTTWLGFILAVVLLILAGSVVKYTFLDLYEVMEEYCFRDW